MKEKDFLNISFCIKGKKGKKISSFKATEWTDLLHTCCSQCNWTILYYSLCVFYFFLCTCPMQGGCNVGCMMSCYWFSSRRASKTDHYLRGLIRWNDLSEKCSGFQVIRSVLLDSFTFQKAAKPQEAVWCEKWEMGLTISQFNLILQHRISLSHAS